MQKGKTTLEQKESMMNTQSTKEDCENKIIRQREMRRSWMHVLYLMMNMKTLLKDT